MMKSFVLYIIFLIGLVNIAFAQIPYNQRYTASVFSDINITYDVIYGNAPAINYPYLDENNISPQDLLMDIFQPEGDILEFRPTLVFAHPGGFYLGSKEAEDMVAFCDSMAHRGYVTATINYRLGMNIFSAESATRAVYRGIQDGRSAIRFLKENAILYGIDTNNIYFLGSSAGAYIGLHNYYMDTEDERPPATYLNPDLGCLDCSGNIFEHSGKADGLVALWGSLLDTNLIISSDTLPIFLVHGTADVTVPFGYGSAFGNDYFPPTYGSSLVAEQLESLGNDALTYFVQDVGHEFYGTSNGNWSGNPNAYWDTVFNKVESFYYEVQKPTAGFVIQQYENVAILYDTSSMATSWYWDFGDGNYSTEQNPTHTFEQSGEFNIIQFVSNELSSWDTTSSIAYVTVGVDANITVDIQIYPNPTSEKVTIANNHNQNIHIKLISTTGIVLQQYELLKSHKQILDVSNYPKGIYLISVSNEDNYSFKKLLVF